MTGPEIDRLVTEVLAALQRNNFTDRPMTSSEAAAANLAVRYTVKRLTKQESAA